jgi:hypothetical protein
MFIKNPAAEDMPAIKKKASDYKGVISAELAEEMQEYVKQSRKEWNHRI